MIITKYIFSGNSCTKLLSCFKNCMFTVFKLIVNSPTLSLVYFSQLKQTEPLWFEK